MCLPVIVALAVIASIAGNVAKNKAAGRAEKALDNQNAIQAEQISDSAGVEMDKRSREARQERAAARVSASESGINLGSNSFMALLQESEVHQSIDQSVVLKNERNQQQGRQASYEGKLSQIEKKTGLGIALDATVAGVSAYASGGGSMFMGAQPGKG